MVKQYLVAQYNPPLSTIQTGNVKTTDPLPTHLVATATWHYIEMCALRLLEIAKIDTKRWLWYSNWEKENKLWLALTGVSLQIEIESRMQWNACRSYGTSLPFAVMVACCSVRRVFSNRSPATLRPRAARRSRTQTITNELARVVMAVPATAVTTMAKAKSAALIRGRTGDGTGPCDWDYIDMFFCCCPFDRAVAILSTGATAKSWGFVWCDLVRYRTATITHFLTS